VSVGDEKESINVKRALAALKAKQTTKSHVEGSDEQRKTPKVYTGPEVKYETTTTEHKKKTTPADKTQPPRSALTKPKNTITDIANDLYVQANFPSVAEQKKAVETMGISAARNTQFKPKNLTELKARAGLGLIEPLIGGVEDLTLGLTLSSSRSRPATQQVRIIGAIATPSALDYAAGYGLNKLMSTSTGRKIIAKLNQYGDDVAKYFTSDEEKQFNKIIGNIDDLKGKDPGEFAEDYKKTIKEIAEYYEKHPQAARQQVVLDLEFNKPQYDKFLSKYALDLDLPASTITAYLMRLTPKQQTEYLAENTKLSSTQISDTIEQLREMNQQRIESDEALVIITEPVIAQTEIPGIAPIEESTTRSAQTQEPASAQEQETVQVTAQTEIPTVIPILRLNPQSEERKSINLRLFNGPRERYRVKFTYPKGGKEVITVDARSFPEAVNRAQMARKPNKYPPSITDVVRSR